MKHFGLFLVSLFGFVTLAVAAPAPASAEFNLIPVCETETKATVCNENKAKGNPIYGPNGILTKVANIIAIVVGIVAVIIIILAGIQYMLSTGDSTKLARSKDAIIYALIGLVIVVLARTAVAFIVSKFGQS